MGPLEAALAAPAPAVEQPGPVQVGAVQPPLDLPQFEHLPLELPPLGQLLVELPGPELPSYEQLLLEQPPASEQLGVQQPGMGAVEVALAAAAVQQSNAGLLEVEQGCREEQGSGKSDAEVPNTPEVLESIVCAGAGYLQAGSKDSSGRESWDDQDSEDSPDDEGSLYEDNSGDSAN